MTKHQQDEWQAAGRLAGQGLAAVVGIVRDTHRAVARRVEDASPEAAAEAIAVERAVSSRIYDVVAGAHRDLPVAAAEIAAIAAPGSSPTGSRAGAAVQAAVNALWGDRIEAQAGELAIAMALRADGSDLPLDPDALVAAFPAASGDIVVFVHGLGEDERAWHLPYAGDPTSYGERLAVDGAYSALELRYNTGRHVSDNGRDLDALLEDLLRVWPVPVTSLSLVGHSMGGLVARSAAHQGSERATLWTQRLRTVATLGTPHLGAPLERAAHVVDRALRLAPESEPVGRILANRSAGIKDLRYGALLQQDWTGEDPDEFLRDRCADVPFLHHVTYCWVSASLTSDPDHPLGQLLGDGLVRYGSASGNGHHTRTGFPIDNGSHVAGIGHLRLLNHPAVFEQLRGWLSPDQDPAAGAGSATVA